MMDNLDLNQILRDSLQTLQPVAKEREITLVFESQQPALPTELPMDEVLVPVFSLVLRLMYIILKGRTLTVASMLRKDAELGAVFLRVEVRTKGLPFNPNIIFRPENNRFKAEYDENNQLIYFIEWRVETPLAAVEAEKPGGFELADKSNDILLNPVGDGTYFMGRFEAFGKSAHIQEKLKAGKSRKDSDFLEEVIAQVGQHLHDSRFDSEALGRAIGFSKAQLFRKLKALTGFSTANYIRHLRLLKAAELLETTEIPIGDVAEKVGFDEGSYFSSSFLAEFHVSPSQWRKANKK